ncbi:PVC-type heme-binding CxxCH protein [Roseimaritima sediminicola]|uniref:PVC-type heme-binding CxxCH protein n=1 Tax=Roseimaritima sediminicola TaxID=2662066 RepID=UPI0013873274|nr:PVC-type heme-binding CxxCH protein [Roseimaritima sediminicola]
MSMLSFPTGAGHPILWLVLVAAVLAPHVTSGEELRIPRRQDAPPGPPLSPQAALDKMEVPEGFSVQLVASEPQLMNPVAMCIDDAGRFWVTESFEYPRRQPGPGRDRIKVLEDTDRDGVVDKVTVFAEGLNIPSGIQVGHGGVWVANAPDLLFLEDTDGDLRADKTTKVLTGFGRTDTHELPNAFTWGPDGYLYGLNGVFNHCRVRYTPQNPNYQSGQEPWRFTCAVWRLDPRTWEFEIFAEGTSNPWGIAINPAGDFFLSACVIDHLWHVAETGYYIRQGGPYPAYTWPMPSIVQHKHQKAAYCGIVHFDSDAYPPEYRNTLYMGNVHAGCLNADVLEPRGASYFGKPREDFLTANDVWFMPVSQQVGPDGCLYVLDWYDRYHCYQDANADPEGVDRGHGRLYRVRYQNTPAAEAFDLQAETDEQLLRRLASPNIYWRERAQRILAERSDATTARRLLDMVNDADTPQTARRHALWTLLSGTQHRAEDLLRLCDHSDPVIAAWSVRGLGDHHADDDAVGRKLRQMAAAETTHPRTRVQLIVAAGKASLAPEDKTAVVRDCLLHSNDPTITHLAWNAVLPWVRKSPATTVEGLLVAKADENVQQLLPRLLPVLCDSAEQNLPLVQQILTESLDAQMPSPLTTAILEAVISQTQQGRFSAAQRQRLARAIAPQLRHLIDQNQISALMLAAMWGDAAGQRHAATVFQNALRPTSQRVAALETLIYSNSPNLLESLRGVLLKQQTSPELRAAVLDQLGRASHPEIADLALQLYPQLPGDVKPKVIELLTQRSGWSEELLQAIAAERVPREALNLNQLRRLASATEPAVQRAVAEVYGQVRTDRRSDRSKIIQHYRERLASADGDPIAGEASFMKVCGQCHQIYGKGAAVGPDITRNGRNDWNQLLHNVLDPSAVIGPGYQARTVVTADGRVLTGLAVEESDQRVVLKLQGGKVESIPRDEIEVFKINEVSMMPEELEKQLTPKEIADLFAFLALDKPPRDPEAKKLPGAP